MTKDGILQIAFIILAVVQKVIKSSKIVDDIDPAQIFFVVSKNGISSSLMSQHEDIIDQILFNERSIDIKNMFRI